MHTITPLYTQRLSRAQQRLCTTRCLRNHSSCAHFSVRRLRARQCLYTPQALCTSPKSGRGPKSGKSGCA
eukprot:7050075-Pyramimonas_sp.AAC.1